MVLDNEQIIVLDDVIVDERINNSLEKFYWQKEFSFLTAYIHLHIFLTLLTILRL